MHGFSAQRGLRGRWRAERNFWISFICFFLWWWVRLPGYVQSLLLHILTLGLLQPAGPALCGAQEPCTRGGGARAQDGRGTSRHRHSGTHKAYRAEEEPMSWAG